MPNKSSLFTDIDDEVWQFADFYFAFNDNTKLDRKTISKDNHWVQLYLTSKGVKYTETEQQKLIEKLSKHSIIRINTGNGTYHDYALANKKEYSAALKPILGQGGQGKVLQALSRKNNQAVAVKVYKTNKKELSLDLEQSWDEAEIAKAMGLTNTSSLATRESSTLEKDHDFKIYSIMNLIPGDSYFKEAIETKSNVSSKQARELISLISFRNCCNEIAKLHDKGFIHCDLKFENFMISRNNDETIILTPIDFGFAINAKVNQPIKTSGTLITPLKNDKHPENLTVSLKDLNGAPITRGTRYYCSDSNSLYSKSKNIRYNEVDLGIYSQKTDVFALGKMLKLLNSTVEFFDSQSDTVQMDLKNDIINLANKMTIMKPRNERTTANQVVWELQNIINVAYEHSKKTLPKDSPIHQQVLNLQEITTIEPNNSKRKILTYQHQSSTVTKSHFTEHNNEIKNYFQQALEGENKFQLIDVFAFEYAINIIIDQISSNPKLRDGTQPVEINHILESLSHKQSIDHQQLKRGLEQEVAAFNGHRFSDVMQEKINDIHQKYEQPKEPKTPKVTLPRQ